MTRDQLKKLVASARNQKFDPSPYKQIQKGLAQFREAGKALADMAKKNPNA